jgi:dGTPase
MPAARRSLSHPAGIVHVVDTSPLTVDLDRLDSLDRPVRHAHEGAHAFVGGPVVGRAEREALLDAALAPGATRPIGAGERELAEEPDPFRLCFERDLDRVKHSRPWRRLGGKCQVFVAPEDDHLRTRLTHAVEVAQVATGIARAANLCLPLVEAIALAHDCGHGPAGHASEEAFSPYLPTGYDHAVYGADMTLASLNLCVETLDGVRNHSWRRPAPSTPEGEVVAWADRIAYVCHDFEDACRAGILAPADLPSRVVDVVGTRRSEQIGTFVLAVLDAIERTGSVGMSEPAAGALADFRAFNFERIYLRPAARRQAGRVVALLQGLVEHFADVPARIPDVASGAVPTPPAGSSQAAARAVHYVSGMTDRFALRLGVDVLGWRPDDLPRGV